MQAGGWPDPPMKIAFVSTILGFPWGGADTLWTRAAEAAGERGDELFISVSPVVAASPRIAALRAAGAKINERTPAVVPVSIGARLTRKLHSLGRYRGDPLVAALARFQPDLAIFSLGGTYDLSLHPAWFNWLQATRTKFRLVANWQQEKSVLTGTEQALARDILIAADQVNFVSTRNLTATQRHLGTALANARVIQNPLRWRPADVPPWPVGPVARLATVSRLDEGKGIQLLLQALADCGSSLPSWQLNIHGQGPYESQLRAIAAPLGERVQFRGYVKELRTIWAENHLMVSPALEDGVPMTIPEAMLCQRPVLATCVGGAEDWIVHDRTGFLCSARDAGALSAALRVAFAACDRWETMGRTAAETAAHHYLADDFLQLIAT
jgi:glycosyltransferase involved in cell wall biosynthesis